MIATVAAAEAQRRVGAILATRLYTRICGRFEETQVPVESATVCQDATCLVLQVAHRGARGYAVGASAAAARARA